MVEKWKTKPIVDIIMIYTFTEKQNGCACESKSHIKFGNTMDSVVCNYSICKDKKVRVISLHVLSHVKICEVDRVE